MAPTLGAGMKKIAQINEESSRHNSGEITVVGEVKRIDIEDNLVASITQDDFGIKGAVVD